MSNEQRCLDRTAVTLSAELKTLSAITTVKIVDISKCGIGLLASQPLSIGEEVSLNFTLPSYAQNNAVSIHAKVIHITTVRNKYLIGLTTLHLSQHDILVFKEFFNFHQRFEA